MFTVIPSRCASGATVSRSARSICWLAATKRVLIVLVRPGERIPADGVIVSGESAIDEAPVTGESTPVRKGVDANVFAGTVNSDAVLRIRVLPLRSVFRRFPKLVREIAGSVGKTGTKEALYAALERAAPGRAHRSVKSYNNHTGVPLSLTRMPRESRTWASE